MSFLNLPGLQEQIRYIKSYVNQVVTPITQAEVDSYWNNITPESSTVIYVTRTDMEQYVSSELSKIVDADEVAY